MKSHFKQQHFFGIIILIILIALDIKIKDTIINYFSIISTKSIEIIPKFFNIVSVRNTGAAWGLFRNNNMIIMLISIGMLIIITVFLKFITENYKERLIAIYMIYAGIIGNCIDRFFRNAVVDFLDFYIGNIHWPSFNISDAAICLGASIIIISSFLRSTVKH